jgi:hypothetical protein
MFTAPHRKSRAIASQPLELFAISLAPTANGKMKAEKNPRAKGQRVFHRLREQPSDIMAMRREVGQEPDQRLFDSVCHLEHRLRSRHKSAKLGEEAIVN